MGGSNSEPRIFMSDGLKQKRIPWSAVFGSEGRHVRCKPDRRGDKVGIARCILPLLSLEGHCDQ